MNGLSRLEGVNGSADRVLADLVVEITDRRRAGETVDVGMYAARHPELADRLRALLPALELLDFLSSTGPGSPEEPGDALSGTLGDFRLIRELGRGGMGVVYEAEQVSLGRRVALKVLPFAATMDPRHLQRFQNEARAAASLHHTNIVPVYAVGCERAVHFYAMQMIEGRTVAAIIQEQGALLARRDQRPTVPEAVGAAVLADAPTPLAAAVSTIPSVRTPAYFRTVAEMGIQAAEALDHAHQMGIVHRDVKPSNLMIDAAGRLWLTDFGLAQLQSDVRITMTGDLVGTLRYMSPEQALAKRVVIDHRTDVYSLGATLYELLTLTPVFDGKDRQELLRQLAFEEPRSPRKLSKAIPTEMETIVLKALEKNPAERYATAQELADDLRRFLDDRALHARRPTVVQRVRKWSRRHRPLVWSAATVLILTIAILAGSIGWVARDRTARQSATEAVVQVAMDESTSWQQRRRLPEALSAARRAAGLVAGGEASEAMRRRVRDRLADLELLDKLDNARLELTDWKDHHFDYERYDRLNRDAFHEYGLDLDALSSEVAGERIRGSTVGVEVAASLDHWAISNSKKKWPDDTTWKHLLRVARAADPDGERIQFRDALEQGDETMLSDLSLPENASRLLPSTLSALAWTLGTRPTEERLIALLREGQRLYPNDFWVNFDLGHAFSNSTTPQFGEAIRFYTVAVALRPQSYTAHSNLGETLRQKGEVNEAIAEFREAIRLNKDFAFAHHNLAVALKNKGNLDEAIAEYREAIRLKKDYADAHNNLGVALNDKGNLDEAIAEFREAIRLNKDHAGAHHNLGMVLRETGNLDEAITECREAIRLKKDYADAHNNLGVALNVKGNLDEAIDEFREAVRLKKDYADAHNNLGIALKDKGNLDEAIDEYREAIRLKKDYAGAHSNLGNALRVKGNLDEAITECREAIRLKKDDAAAHCNLGIALKDKGNLDEAIDEYREAIRLKKDDAEAHNNLGMVLRHKGNLDEAITECREAIRLKKDYSLAHNSLGAALEVKGEFDEAIAAYREAIRLKKDNAEAHCNLGAALQRKGQFAEALEEWRRGHELGSKDSRWRHPSAQMVRQAEQLVELDAKLPEVLNGRAQPASPVERITLARLCQEFKNLPLAAVRFYRDAFAAEPKLADDLRYQHRYNGACAAALAGCGQGKDATELDDKERAGLRQQALQWLKADLKQYSQDMDKAPAQVSAVIRERLQHWQQDKDFAGVRGETTLAKLPEAERREWKQLWEEVEALVNASDPPKPTVPDRR